MDRRQHFRHYHPPQPSALLSAALSTKIPFKRLLAEEMEIHRDKGLYYYARTNGSWGTIPDASLCG